MSKAERIPVDPSYLYEGFERVIGPGGTNAYGEISVWDEANQKRVPVICGHGGSMWLCRSCAEAILKADRAGEGE